MHGLSFGLTQVGIMGLMVRHVPISAITRAQVTIAACGGIISASASIVAGMIYARYGQGAYYAMAVMAFSGEPSSCGAHGVLSMLLTPERGVPVG